jgi:hypothetical protein
MLGRAGRASIEWQGGKIVIASAAKQSQLLQAEIAGGTGILPVIPNRQAGRLSHHSLLAMTENGKFRRALNNSAHSMLVGGATTLL